MQKKLLRVADNRYFKKNFVYLPPDEKEERIYVKLPTSLKNALNNNPPYAVFFSDKGHRVSHLRHRTFRCTGNRNRMMKQIHQITLLSGRELLCYPKVELSQPIDNRMKLDTTGQYLSVGRRKPVVKPIPPELEEQRKQAVKFFTDRAFFFLDHREKILNDSRMFLAPVPVQSGLAYIGTSGFRRPTLGVYVEWWMTCIPAIISRLHNDTWLVYYIAGSPLSGMNCCGIVNANGECRSENLPNPFRAIWGPFTNINTRYDEAKVRYEAYSLEEVVKLLEANDKGDSLTERKLYLLQRENQVLRQEILDTREADAKAMEKMRVTLLNAHLECKREALTNWYADYCRKQEEGKEVLESLNLQKQQLKQQFRHGEITRMFYQHKLTPLKKRIFNLQQELECMAKKELSELLPELFNRPGDTELITFDEVEEFVKSKNPNQK